MRISDWSSDVCSSDLIAAFLLRGVAGSPAPDNVPPMQISLTVNGERRDVDVPPSMLLVEVLRDRLGLTGTHIGCDTSQCGACNVLMDGQAVKSCTVLAGQADGAEVTTIEGLAEKDRKSKRLNYSH